VRGAPTDRPNSAQIPDSPAALLDSNREVRPPRQNDALHSE
jgi:hypothetical protein